MTHLDTPYWLAIERGFEEYYDKDVDGGRIYQILNRIVEEGEIENQTATNEQTLTQHRRR